MTDFVNPNAFHWTQVYSGLVGQTIGYTASTAYQLAQGNNTITKNIPSFVLSVVREIATAPIVYTTEQINPDSTGYSAILSSAVTQSLLSQSIVTEPILSTDLINPKNITLSISPITNSVSTLVNNPKLAGLIGSTISKVVATTIKGESTSSIAESLWIALTRSVVLGNAISTNSTLPKVLAAAIVGMDLLAIQTESPILHTSSSLGSAIYIGSIAPNNRTLTTLALATTGTALHIISNSH